MEIKVSNDFDARRVRGGWVYEMDLGEGHARVTCFIFGRGFVINYFDMDTPHLANRDRIGPMNYMMINACLMGKIVCRLQDGCVCNVGGTAVIHHPSDSRNDMYFPAGRYIALSIGIDKGCFEPAGLDDLPDIRDVIGSIEERFGIDSYRSFRLNDRLMIDLFSLKRILDDPESIDENLACILVSDIVRGLYTAEEVMFTGFSDAAEPLPEDLLYSRLMSDLSSPPDIGGICGELGFDRYETIKRFRRAYGNTPYSAQKHIRMVRAASDILMGERNMGKVAGSAGYSAECKFAEAFRKEFGCRPKHLAAELFGDLRLNLNV